MGACYYRSARRKILNVIADILHQASEVFRRAINAIIHFGTEQHKSLFAPSEAADIKSVMQEYGETTLTLRHQSLREEKKKIER